MPAKNGFRCDMCHSQCGYNGNLHYLSSRLLPHLLRLPCTQRIRIRWQPRVPDIRTRTGRARNPASTLL